MSLKSNYPVVLNGTTFQPFKTWSVVYNDSVVTHETEGGTQEDAINRKGRRTISVNTVCLEAVARQLVALETHDSFTAKFYELKTGGYVTINVRVAAGSMSASLKEKSANLDYCNGIWDVSFTLEEF